MYLERAVFVHIPPSLSPCVWSVVLVPQAHSTLCREFEMNASAQCLLRNAQPGDCRKLYYKSRSQQTAPDFLKTGRAYFVTMATSPFSLPVELLHDIMLYLDRDSLISVAQSCRVLHAVAVQQLHRNVPRLSGPNTIRCLNTLATTPEIAGKVRTFNIYSSFAVGLFTTALPPVPVRPSGTDIWNRLLAIFRPSPPPLPPLPSPAPPRLHFIAGIERISLQTTANAFYNMKNLHTLIIHAPSHPKLWEFEHPIPTLRTIFVHHNAESPSLFAWIMTQQSVTYLRMNDIFPAPLPIAKWYSLPNLRYLTCKPLGVLHLFPGGRVSELIIEDLFDMSVVDHLATVISSSSAKSGIQLQRLTVYGTKVAINRLLDRLGHFLTLLLFLRIFMVDKPRESVSPIPQPLLIMKGPSLTAINSPYRNVFSSTIFYQSSLVSRLLSFLPRRRVLGISARLLKPPD